MTKNASFSSRFSRLGFLALTCAWLAYDHYRPWVNFHSEFLAFAGLAGLWVGLLREFSSAPAPASSSAPSTSIAIPRISLWIGILAIVPWLQHAFGMTVFAGDAFIASFYIAGCALAIGVGYAGSRAWIHSVWIAALVSAAIGLAQWFHVEGIVFGMFAVAVESGDRAMGNMGQANQLASLLLMGIVALLYALECGIVRYGVAGIAIGFISVVLILTQSRSGMVGALFAAVWLMLKTPHRAIIGLWLVCFVLGTWALPYLSDELRGVGVRGLHATAPISQRWDLWQQMLHAIAESPWFGYGWNQTPAAQAGGALGHPHAIVGGYAHNGVLDLLAWNGIPLGLLLCGAIGYWFISRLRRCHSLHAIYAMASLGVLAIHSLLEYPFAYAYFLITAGLLIGMIEADMSSSSSSPSSPSSPSSSFLFRLPQRGMKGILAVLIPLGLFSGYEYVQIEEDFRVVRYSAMNIHDYADPSYQAPKVVLLTQLGAWLEAKRITVTPTLSGQNTELLGATARRFADDALWCNYAKALALNHNPAASDSVHSELRIIHALFGEHSYRMCFSQLSNLAIQQLPPTTNH
ncbi:MAG: hypothetical protein RIR79_1168 [Pseudomonadota bacterium]